MKRIQEIALRSVIVLIAATGCFGIGYLFYKHILPSVLLSLFGLFAIPWFEKYLKQRRNKGLTGQFRQFLSSFSTSLAAGRAVENAMVAGEHDLRLLFQSEKGIFLDELSRINSQVANGLSADRAFAEFADRSGVEDIRNFSEVFGLCKQSGGDLVELIRRSASIIAEKIEIEQELAVMTAQKSFEAKAMAVVPFAMIAFLAFGSPDYMAPLYEGVGRLIMTGVLIVLTASFFWIRSIMRLEV